MAPMMGQMQAPFRSQAPFPERPTLLFQKATPRNLGDMRSIRESESGSTLEIGEKQEVIMYAMDESYHGAQKLIKSDRAIVAMFLADPSEKDETLEWVHRLQESVDFTQDANYFAAVRTATSKVNKAHDVKPRSVLEQLRP